MPYIKLESDKIIANKSTKDFHEPCSFSMLGNTKMPRNRKINAFIWLASSFYDADFISA